jgi:hypothetical protein
LKSLPEPEQVAEPEHVLGCTAGIGIVLPDGQGTLMMEQSVQNVGGLASVSRDHLGVEWRKPVRDVGIELYAWLRPVVGVVVGEGLTVAASPEELPVGGGSLPVAPESGKGVGMDRIDQTSECLPASS